MTSEQRRPVPADLDHDGGTLEVEALFKGLRQRSQTAQEHRTLAERAIQAFARHLSAFHPGAVPVPTGPRGSGSAAWLLPSDVFALDLMRELASHEPDDPQFEVLLMHLAQAVHAHTLADLALSATAPMRTLGAVPAAAGARAARGAGMSVTGSRRAVVG